MRRDAAASVRELAPKCSREWEFLEQDAGLRVCDGLRVLERIDAGAFHVLHGDNFVAGKTSLRQLWIDSMDALVAVRSVASRLAPQQTKRLRFPQDGHLVPVGEYILSERAIAEAVYLAKQNKSTDVPGLLAHLVARGLNVTVAGDAGERVNINSPRELFDANLTAMRYLESGVTNEALANCSFTAMFYVRDGDDVSWRGARVIGPSCVGRRAEIDAGTIGPRAVVSDCCKLQGCLVRDSVLFGVEAQTETAFCDCVKVEWRTCE